MWRPRAADEPVTPHTPDPAALNSPRAPPWPYAMAIPPHKHPRRVNDHPVSADEHPFLPSCALGSSLDCPDLPSPTRQGPRPLLLHTHAQRINDRPVNVANAPPRSPAFPAPWPALPAPSAPLPRSHRTLSTLTHSASMTALSALTTTVPLVLLVLLVALPAGKNNRKSRGHVDHDDPYHDVGQADQDQWSPGSTCASQSLCATSSHSLLVCASLGAAADALFTRAVMPCACRGVP